MHPEQGLHAPKMIGMTHFHDESAPGCHILLGKTYQNGEKYTIYQNDQ
jgi:hypothetical protein